MLATTTLPTARPIADADATDEQLIALWLHGRSAHTARAYRRDVGRLLGFVDKPLRAVTLGDLQRLLDRSVCGTLCGELTCDNDGLVPFDFCLTSNNASWWEFPMFIIGIVTRRC